MSSNPPPVIPEAPSDTAADLTLPLPQSPPPPAPPVTSPPPERQSESTVTGRIIVIGCDETEAAKRSIAWCLDNLATTNDKIILMRAIPLSSFILYPSFGLIPPPFFEMPDAVAQQRIEEGRQKKALDQIASLIPVLEEKKIPYRIEIVTVVGSDWNADAVADAIWRRSEELKASLIIVAKHNRGLIKEMFTGSVTTKLIHLSKQPVLVFHV